MNISQTTLRIGTALGTIVAIVLLAAPAQAETSKPAGMSQPAFRALVIRSEALDKLYGNAVTPLSHQQFNELYQAGANGMAPQEFAALVTRSEALDRRYGLNRPSQPTRVVGPPADSGNGLDWGDFGIGAAAMMGLVLLSGGLLAGTYFGRKIGVPPRSVS